MRKKVEVAAEAGEKEKGCAPPRAYRLGKRQAAADENRTKILAAARDLIMSDDALKGFTVDAVAQKAGVARMTVYYQFKSKLGVLEALFDDLASRGGMEELAKAFVEPEPREALKRYIGTFCNFWASDRMVMRRLRSLNALDNEFGEGIRDRNVWRRGGTRNMVQRVEAKYGLPPAINSDKAADILFMLTGFETFDSLAGDDKSAEEVAPTIYYLALAALGLDTIEP